MLMVSGDVASAAATRRWGQGTATLLEGCCATGDTRSTSRGAISVLRLTPTHFLFRRTSWRPLANHTLILAHTRAAELGDYDPRHHPSGYVSEFRFLPNQTPELESRVSDLHKG